MNDDGTIHFLNIEWLFRQLYELIYGTARLDTFDFATFLTNLWVLVTTLAYLSSFLFLGILIYATIRLRNAKEDEEHEYVTLEQKIAEDMLERSRWTHIMELIESHQDSDWRQAIIEADIMLDAVLKQAGYVGETVGEKLKQANPQRFQTLQSAWEAHKVRNEIAHQGSAFQLTDKIAYRTIGHYKNVFEEFNAI